MIAEPFDLDIKSRLADMPVMAQRPDDIASEHFNLWRRTCLAGFGPVSIRLEGLKTLSMVMDTDFWVVADRAMHYAPVVAWVDFGQLERDSLSAPVRCNVNYYHFAASAVRDRALQQTADALGRLLQAGDIKAAGPAKILSFQKPVK